MTVFKAIFISVKLDHPCSDLRNGDEERMVSIENYLDCMEPAYNAGYLSNELEEELEEVRKHASDDDVTDIIIGGN